MTNQALEQQIQDRQEDATKVHKLEETMRNAAAEVLLRDVHSFIVSCLAFAMRKFILLLVRFKREPAS
jgi:hypothetical protein